MSDGRWAWLRRYAFAFVVLLVLATLFGHSRVFSNAPLAPRGLTAAHLVRFIGYAAALVLLWRAAWRAAKMMRHDRGWKTIAREALVPLASLLILVIGYGVPLILLWPFLNVAMMAIYSWLFVVAIIASAFWLVLAIYRSADALAPVISRLARQATEAAAARHDAMADQASARDDVVVAQRRCPHCGGRVPPDRDVAA